MSQRVSKACPERKNWFEEIDWEVKSLSPCPLSAADSAVCEVGQAVVSLLYKHLLAISIHSSAVQELSSPRQLNYIFVRFTCPPGCISSLLFSINIGKLVFQNGAVILKV